MGMAMAAVPMVELWRGGFCESVHAGHAVICDPQGRIVAAWGDPGALILPRSACKMVQALPLLESGAGAGLSAVQLALACASHQGAAVHVAAVARWLADLGLGEGDLRCGAHEPADRAERDRLIRAGAAPCQLHNNCSGKHAGFLTLARHLAAGPDYVEADHPVQRAVRAAFEEVTGEPSPGFGIDGCSAPNHATSLAGLARAMAAFAAAGEGDARGRAMRRLTQAMLAQPEMVAGEGRACTILIRALAGRAAVKSGAEGVFVAILPALRLGLALKIADGAARAAEAAMVALLVRLGLLAAADPAARRFLGAPLRNWRGIETGELRLAPGFGRPASDRPVSDRPASDRPVSDRPVALLLGAALRRDGRPSAAMLRRTGHAAALWHAGRVGGILASGGAVRHRRPEALVMGELLAAAGVPDAVVTLEPCARNTAENIALARPLLPAGAPVLLVTDRYHMPRALMIARAAGLAVLPEPVPRGAAPALPWIAATLREGPAILKWLVLRR
jgi:L-asparaginase II/uncharacterized SAM-binding protein YcdF (DUF218 family)